MWRKLLQWWNWGVQSYLLSWIFQFNINQPSTVGQMLIFACILEQQSGPIRMLYKECKQVELFPVVCYNMVLNSPCKLYSDLIISNYGSETFISTHTYGITASNISTLIKHANQGSSSVTLNTHVSMLYRWRDNVKQITLRNLRTGIKQRTTAHK